MTTITTSRDFEQAVQRAVALRDAERLLAQARSESRDFTAIEQTQYDALLRTIQEIDNMDETTIINAPAGATRPVIQAVRSLSAAVLADKLVERMLANGKARMEIPIDIRAIGSSQALNPVPGIEVTPQAFGIVQTYHGIVFRLLNALTSVPVSSNSVTYTRLRFHDPIGSPPDSGGNKAAKVQELAPKPESVLQSDEVTQTIDTWAHWLPASKQVLDDVVGLRALIDNMLTQGLLDKIDAGVYTEMTTSGNYTPFTPTGGYSIGENIATLATNLLISGAQTVKIAMNPVTLLAMKLVKASGSGEYLGLPDLGATIVASASVPAGKLLSWSDGGVVWASREGVTVTAGLNADDFTHNRVTILAEARGAVLTLDPTFVRYGNAV